MSSRERRTFPLLPRRRLTGLPMGDFPGRRRGHGTEVIGTRPYEPGDPVATIDWFATARLSAASGGDEFVVRDRAADETPRVIVLLDRRPSMSLYPAPLPWLSKQEAQRQAAIAVAASAAAARADIGSLDLGSGEEWWLPPGRRDRAWLVAERAGAAAFDAPDDTIVRAFDFLRRHRTDAPGGTFVFVVSDFLAGPPTETWLDALAQGWDLVPVVVQDRVWERSWPNVGGVAVPVADPRSGSRRLVRLSRRRCGRLRREHEARYAALLAELASVGLRPVEVDSSDPWTVDEAFLAWAEERRRGRWAR
ncbi:MAG TPA: DUF58 domain-containing protein [Gaiellaceae bacterium]|jgi:uncharacterized protein (DUF58 family)